MKQEETPVIRMERKSGGLCSALFFLLWICTHSRCSAEDDLPCLMEFKNSVTDPLHSLANWDFRSNISQRSEGVVCSWNGVQCWNNQENKVLSLNLSGAGFSGPFRPLALSKCAALTALDLSSNSFTGPLPLDICQHIQSLTILDLSHNLLEGSIPPNLANCTYLNELFLQDNHLSGEIPWQLGVLPRLTGLDLSYNALSGRIPSSLTNGSKRFDAATFANNSLLCGSPALSECVPPSSPSLWASLRRKWKVLLLIIGASIILLALLLFIALVLAAWLQKAFSKSNLHLLESHLKVTWEEVQRATSSFSPANIVGSGGSSTVYKGRLLDGREIAVKVFHNEELGSSHHQYTPKQLFLTELRLLAKLRHRNLVKILGFYCDSDSMAIILDYMPAGSLDALLLHESATSNLAFGWKARLHILLGIAEGLAYLHNEYDGKLSVIHADRKPGNVLLDEYMEAHITDFGIATCVSTINNSSVGSSKGQVLPVPCWSLGYTAPECVQQGLVSRKGDVFSFGVIVLEVITGERPSSNKLKEGESLAEWVSKALVEGVVERVIVPMLSSVQELLRWKEDLSATLRMGCSCASIARASRPDMSEVVTFLRRLCEKLENTALNFGDILI